MNDAALTQIKTALKTSGFEEIHFERFTRLYAMLGVTGRGLGIFDLLDAALKYPQLLYQKPETIDGKAESSAALLGITKQAFVAIGLRQPSLLCQEAATLDGNAIRSAALLGIAKPAFVTAALKQPQLLSRKPETLDGNAGKSAALLGITKQAFVAIGLRQPSLLCQKPATLDGNAIRSAALLGIAKPAFVTAALKQPQLLCQKPDTLDANAKKSAALLGITKKAFVAAALKQPQLLYSKPETLGVKKHYILNIRDALKYSGNFDAFIVNAPVALSCSASRLHACYILAKLDLTRGSLSSLVTVPSRDAERLLVNHFTDRIAASGRGTRTLQIMNAMGMVKTLPEGIPAIPRPVRRRISPQPVRPVRTAEFG